MGSASDSITPVDQALNAIEQSFRKEASTCPWFRSPKYSVLFAEIETAADQFLSSVASAASGKETDIVDRIRKRRSSLSLSSDITSEVVGVCKQVLAFGAAGLGLSLGFADKILVLNPAVQKAIAIAGIVYLELVLVSLLVLLWYLLQARFRYPFLSFERIGNTWPWFYYASISPEVPREPIQFAPRRLRSAALYAKDIVRFASKVVAETEADELRLEMQQYFLLLSYQGYVHQFSLRLTNLFFYGFTGALLTGLFLTIWAVSI